MKDRRLALLSLPLVLIALVAASCGSVAKPQGWAAPVTDDSTVYLFPKKSQLAAVDTTNGTVRWTFPDSKRAGEKDIKLEAVYGAPVIAGDTVYLGSYDGGLFALSKTDGHVIWKVALDGSIVGGPIVAGDRVFVGTTEGKFYVRSAADGSPVSNWDAGGMKFGKGIWAPPVVQGDTVFVATMGGELQAFGVADAQPRWQQPFKVSGAIADLAAIPPGGDPAAAPTQIFVPTLNKHVFVVDMATGEQKLDFRADNWVWTSPAFKGNDIYFGDFDGKVYVLDITKPDNPLQWSYKAKAQVKAAPVVIGDVLVVADREPAVYFLDTASGKYLNSVPLQSGTVRADLVKTDSVAYVETTSGKLYVAHPDNYSVTQLAIGQASQ